MYIMIIVRVFMLCACVNLYRIDEEICISLYYNKLQYYNEGLCKKRIRVVRTLTTLILKVSVSAMPP